MILVTLTEDLQIECDHQRRAAGRLGALDQICDEFAIAHHIELEPERRLGMGGDILERADAHGRECERHTEFLGRAGRQNLAVGMHHAGRPGRGDGDRHGDVLADHLRAQAAVLQIDRHALAKLNGLEIRFVGAVGAFAPRAGIDIIVEHARHALFHEYAQIFDGGDDAQTAAAPKYCA